MKFIQFRKFCLLNFLMITCLAYKFTKEEEKHTSLERIRRYVTRQVTGPCYYGMCNETDDYPFEEIEKLVDSSVALKKLFGNVVIPNPGIASKFLGESMNMCDTETLVLRPRKAQDMNGDWQTIVNVDKYSQIVTVESCVEGRECYAQKFLSSIHETRCTPQQIVVRMVSLTKEADLKLENFPVNVGCRCTYVQDLSKL